MKALNAIQIINDLAASQQGLFTTAQAQTLGIEKVSLARLAKHGQIERVGHGVYRAGGAPSVRAEDILAAWMELESATPTYLRDKGPNGFTASLHTAAWLHDIGELNPTPIIFSHPKRRQTRKKNLTFIKRSLDPSEIVIMSGIPTTSPVQTILDLIDYGEDLGLIANVLNDALKIGLIPDETSLVSRINKRAESRGFDPEFSLYEYLRKQ